MIYIILTAMHGEGIVEKPGWLGQSSYSLADNGYSPSQAVV